MAILPTLVFVTIAPLFIEMTETVWNSNTVDPGQEKVCVLTAMTDDDIMIAAYQEGMFYVQFASEKGWKGLDIRYQNGRFNEENLYNEKIVVAPLETGFISQILSADTLVISDHYNGTAIDHIFSTRGADTQIKKFFDCAAAGYIDGPAPQEFLDTLK